MNFWKDFKKELDPEEEKLWEHVVWLAKDSGQPQRISFGNHPLAMIFPSGLIVPYEVKKTELKNQK